jgi:uncharacterized protein
MPTITEFRIAVLARMVGKAPGQKLGRTQVMKFFYFLQELKGVPIGYDFRLFTYGPFDSEVLGDLATASTLDTVAEKAVIYARGYGYAITPGQRANGLSEQLERDRPDVAAMVDEVVDDFATFGAAELELRSTILYVDRELSQGGTTGTRQELATRVHLVKSHFSETTILNRIDQMQGKGWLDGLQPGANSPIRF